MKDKYLKLAGIAGLLIVLDQVTKAAVLIKMPLYHSIEMIPGFFNLVHVRNPGGAFSFFAGQSSFLRLVFFKVVSIAVVVMLIYTYRKIPKTHPLLSISFALIIGGATGNLIDRFRFGSVIDFLDFYLGSMHWPAFNIADSGITIGIFILIWHLLFKKMPDNLI
ncbi:MAG: signal peptidase II [Desulfobacterales bacterium]|nr:signal peptidase II [Desulfobacterales bacterium]